MQKKQIFSISKKAISTANPSKLPPLNSLYFYPDYTSTNPYQTALYSAVTNTLKAQAGTIDLSIAALPEHAEQTVLFHLHWPEPIFAGVTTVNEFRERSWDFQKKLNFFRANGGVFIWTIHNVLPHDNKFDNLNRDFHEQLAKVADIVHIHSKEAIKTINEHYALDERKCVVIPHGSFNGYYKNEISRKQARNRIGIKNQDLVFGSIGQIRPYKGLEQLLTATKILHSQDPRVKALIAGKPVLPTKPGQWENLAKMLSNFLIVDEGFIADDDLQYYFKAVDFIVLPYKNILTSGSVVLAADFGKIVVIPALSCLESLFHLDFIETFDPNHPSSLVSTLKKVKNFSPEEISQRQASALDFSKSLDWRKLIAPLEIAIQKCIDSARPRVIKIGSVSHEIRIHQSVSVPPGSLGVAIVNYHNKEEVSDLYKTLPKTINGHPVVAYLWDNTGNSTSENYFHRIYPDMIVAGTDKNLGYAGGNNILLQMMREDGCRFGFIVNPDIEILPGCMEALVREHDGSNTQAIYSPLILKSDGKVSFGGTQISKEKDIQVEPIYDGVDVEKVPSSSFAVDSLNGCAIFLDLSILDKIGFIPEEYFLYYEETEWCMHATNKGVDCVVVPQARVVHHKKSHGQQGIPSLYYIYYMLRNTILFNRRLKGDIDSAIQQQQTKFVSGWRKRLIENDCHFEIIFDQTVQAGFSDGLDGISGQVCLNARIQTQNKDQRPLTAGAVDKVESTGDFKGWAATRKKESGEDNTWESTKLWLIIDDIPVTLVETGGSRPDVAAAGYCTATGFSATLPDRYLDNDPHKVEFRDASTGVNLPFGFKEGETELNLRFIGTPKKISKSRNIRGRIDGVSMGTLKGWIHDFNRHESAVLIDLRIGEHLIQNVQANLYRPDLKSAGIGKGHSGFEIKLPNELLAEKQLQISMSLSGENLVFKEKEISVNQYENGFHADMKIEQFVKLSFTDDRMPPGIYQRSQHLKQSFEVTKTLLLEEDCGEDETISVIMPLYNRAKLVENAIQSVITQSYTNWELIIVDDGSSDESYKVVTTLLNDLNDARITLLKHEINRGVSAARNTGTSASTGSIISYLDSDNIWDSDYLGIIAIALDKHPDADAAYCGQEIWEYLPHFDVTELRWIRACPFNRSRLEFRNFIDLNVFAHRRSCLETYGNFRENMRRLVDWELILRYTEDKPPVFMPVLMNQYFVGIADNQITAVEPFESHLSLVRDLHGQNKNGP